MRVQDVMTRNVKTVSPTTPAEDAWHLMRVHDIHHLVVRDDGRVVGVLSDRDAGGRRGYAVRVGNAVADLMSTPALTVRPTTTVRQAANLMRGHSIGCLVVTDAQRLRGIVTTSDLLELVGRGLDRGAAPASRRTRNHRVPHRKTRGATGLW